MDLISKLKSSYPTYTKTEKKIVDFLLNDPENYPYLHITLEDLSKQIGVGQASIVRFVKKNEFATYRNFLAALYESAHETVIASRVIERQSGNTLLEDLVKQLQNTNANIQSSTLQTIADQMVHADIILCLGMGNSAHVASLAASRLRSEGLIAFHETFRDVNLYTGVIHRNLNTVVLAFSASGETPELIYQVREYEEAGAYVAAFTGHLESTLAQYSNTTLYTASQITSGSHDRDLHSILTMLYVIEMLVEAYLLKINKRKEE